MFDNISLLVAAPVLNVQLLLDGLFVGSIFALAAYGLALVWGVMNVKNLAQGDFVILGGYIAYVLYKLGIHPIFGLPVAIVLMFGFGWIVYRVIISRVVYRDMFTSLLATFGLAIAMQQLMNIIFGSEVQTAESGFEIRSFFGDMVTVADIKFVSFILTAILASIVVTFMRYSRMGQAIRATAQDPRAAKVLGIDTERVYAFTYALNASICASAGVLISMIWIIQPFFGLGMGVIEQFGSFILGLEYQQAIVVGLLVLVLIVRQIQQRRHRQAVV